MKDETKIGIISWAGLLCILVVFACWVYTANQEFSAHQNRFTAFCVSTGLPYKQCKIDSPYLIVVAQNETEFRQAITNLNATTVYWSDGFYVYVFSSDYKIAHRYYVP